MITLSDEKTEKALDYLATSAGKYSKARGLVTWLEERKKIVEAMQFNSAPEGMAVDAKKSFARASKEYIEVCQQYSDAVIEELHIRALREGACAVIDCWRSAEASRRASNV